MQYRTLDRRAVRKWGIACLIAIQAALPCLAPAQPDTSSRPAVADPKALPGASGFINSISGAVFMTTASGVEVQVKTGDVFGPGTTFRTGADSTAVLLFADGQNIALGHDSALRLGDYKFDAGDVKSSKSTMALTSGMMRFVSGAILADNHAGLSITAGNASVAILSKDTTAFVVEVDPKSIAVGSLAVTIGEVSIQTPAGTVDSVAADQFSRWQAGLPPAAPMPIGAAPATVQAAAAALRAVVLGSNAPLDVEAAATLAAITNLPATAAGTEQQNQQAQAPESTVAAVTPSVTPGGGRGCVGSPC